MYTHLHDFFIRFERPISSFSLVGGFIFDAVTLTRVDTWWQNLWIVCHLAIVAVCILLINRRANNAGDEYDISKMHFWLLNILQFFFGGLLSANLILYFRSSELSVSWPFILILALAFVANEILKKHYVRVGFQVSLFFLSLFAYFIIEVPVVLHVIGPEIFVLSGAVSLAVMVVFLLLLRAMSTRRFNQGRWFILGGVLGTFIVVNVCYFTNVIPPVPLALKDAGIYHSVARDDRGNYLVTVEKGKSWKDLFTRYEVIHEGPSNPIYAYSAVFSPTKFNFTLIHHWQWYDEGTQRWVSKAHAELPVVGGRDGGFRTYSHRTDLDEGRWRVSVETVTGAVIGKLHFKIVKIPVEPEVIVEVKSK